MKVFTDTNNIKIVQSIASASALISSLTGEIKEYISSQFPKNFLKKIYIDTSSSINEINKNKKKDRNMLKIAYPSMTISPEISIDDPLNIGKIPQISSPNLYIHRDLNRNYSKIMLDPDNKIAMYYSCDQITTNFNIKIFTNSYIQNADVVFYIKSHFQLGYFLFLNNRLISTEIPKTFINILAELMPEIYDKSEEFDMIQLEKYLLSTGKQYGAIRKKINLNTGKECFFFDRKDNLVITIQDLDSNGDIIRNNQAEGEYIVNFRVQVSAWLPNAFIMSVDKELFRPVAEDDTIVNEIYDDNSILSDGSFYSTSIVDPITLLRKETIHFTDSQGTDCIGQNIYHELFTFDIAKGITSIDIKKYLNETLLKMHAYMTSTKRLTMITDEFGNPVLDENGQITYDETDTSAFDLTSLFNIKIRSKKMEDSEEDFYTIDYDNLIVNITTTIQYDFILEIYLNRAEYELVEYAMNNDSFYFNDNALTKMYFTIDLVDNDDPTLNYTETIPVNVYRFRNDEELYSDSYMFALRIQTIYGPGYIGVTNEDAPNATDYKVCLGTDIYGNPIIKAIAK